MRVFVGQQGPAADAGTPVREVVGAGSVLTGLVMFQAFAADDVADGKEKIIVSVVMRGEKLLCLDHQVFVKLQFLRRDFKIGRLVGEYVEKDGVVRTAGEVEALEVGAGVEGRIDERVQGCVFELNRVAVLRFDVECAGKLPSFGQADGSVEVDAAGKVSGGIKKNAVPGHVGEL